MPVRPFRGKIIIREYPRPGDISGTGVFPYYDFAAKGADRHFYRKNILQQPDIFFDIKL